VIDFKSHWRATGLASRIVQPTVQTHRFQSVGAQAFGTRNNQIPRLVSRHEEWGNLTLLSFRADRRSSQQLRDFAAKLLESVVALLQERVRQNPEWIFACDVLSAHSDGCDVRKSLPYYHDSLTH
jgi:hypothetical protein